MAMLGWCGVDVCACGCTERQAGAKNKKKKLWVLHLARPALALSSPPTLSLPGLPILSGHVLPHRRRARAAQGIQGLRPVREDGLVENAVHAEDGRPERARPDEAGNGARGRGGQGLWRMRLAKKTHTRRQLCGGAED